MIQNITRDEFKTSIEKVLGSYMEGEGFSYGGEFKKEIDHVELRDQVLLAFDEFLDDINEAVEDQVNELETDIAEDIRGEIELKFMRARDENLFEIK